MKKLLLLNFIFCISFFSFSQINDVGVLENELLINAFTGSTVSIYDGFTPGLKVYNLGSADQDSVIVSAIIDGPGGVVYNETLGPFAINSGDTLSIFPSDTVFFPAWQLGVFNYTEGDYTLTYDLSMMNTTDEKPHGQFIHFTLQSSRQKPLPFKVELSKLAPRNFLS